MIEMQHSQSQVMVVLSVRPALEEPIVDWLLAWNGGCDFSRLEVAEHSASHEHLNAAERVLGRQKRLQFELRLPAQELDALLASARSRFGGADVHYWILPLLGEGILSAAEDRLASAEKKEEGHHER